MHAEPQKKIPFFERMGGSVDAVRSWLFKAWRLGTLMAKGAYLIGERKTLLHKLGQETYRCFQNGQLSNATIEPLVRQLDRLNKKIEIEETLIENLRYGVKHGRRGTRLPHADSQSESVSP